MCARAYRRNVVLYKHALNPFLDKSTSAEVLTLPAPRRPWERLTWGPGGLRPRSAGTLAGGEGSLLILAGNCVVVTRTAGFHVELNCLFTVTIRRGHFIISTVGIWVPIPLNAAENGVRRLWKISLQRRPLRLPGSCPLSLGVSVNSPVLPRGPVFPFSCRNQEIRQLKPKFSLRQLYDFTWQTGAHARGRDLGGLCQCF